MSTHATWKCKCSQTQWFFFLFLTPRLLHIMAGKPCYWFALTLRLILKRYWKCLNASGRVVNCNFKGPSSCPLIFSLCHSYLFTLWITLRTTRGLMKQNYITLMTVLSFDFKGRVLQESRRTFHSLSIKIELWTESRGILEGNRSDWFKGLMYRFLSRPQLSQSEGLQSARKIKAPPCLTRFLGEMIDGGNSHSVT